MEHLLVAVQMITVHMLDGREVLVNSAAIAQLQPGRADDDPKRVIIKGVYCVIFFPSGRYLSVVETCDEVRNLIEAKP
jgi:uncharacterized protein YlzI (FlbEa/FlbD family)